MKKLPKEKIARLMGHLKTIAENGIQSNPERFVHEEDQIYVIKDFQIRIYCFRHKGSLLILTHGTVKSRIKLILRIWREQRGSGVSFWRNCHETVWMV
jgi:hypothetical protein